MKLAIGVVFSRIEIYSTKCSEIAEANIDVYYYSPLKLVFEIKILRFHSLP